MSDCHSASAGRAAKLLGLAINEVAFPVEVVVNIGVDRSEFLQCLHSPETDQRDCHCF